MTKDFKAVAIKQSQGTGENQYTFIVKGNNPSEAYANAKHHIANTFEAEAFYHIELSVIGESLNLQ